MRMKLAMALAATHDREGALREGQQAMAELPESSDAIAGRHLALEFAEVCALLGEAEKACDMIERMVTVEIKFTRRMAAHTPAFRVLRGYPRFDKIVGR